MTSNIDLEKVRCLVSPNDLPSSKAFFKDSSERYKLISGITLLIISCEISFVRESREVNSLICHHLS